MMVLAARAIVRDFLYAPALGEALDISHADTAGCNSVTGVVGMLVFCKRGIASQRGLTAESLL